MRTVQASHLHTTSSATTSTNYSCPGYSYRRANSGASCMPTQMRYHPVKQRPSKDILSIAFRRRRARVSQRARSIIIVLWMRLERIVSAHQYTPAPACAKHWVDVGRSAEFWVEVSMEGSQASVNTSSGNTASTVHRDNRRGCRIALSRQWRVQAGSDSVDCGRLNQVLRVVDDEVDATTD